MYGEFIKKANDIYDDFTTGKGKRLSLEDRRSNQNAQNLNRQGTSKAAIGMHKGSTLSVAGS